MNIHQVGKNVEAVRQTLVFDNLPVAKGSAFDSYTEGQNPTCLPDTRVELLQQILDWAHDPDASAIFWLNGMAGTGKSTVSRTIAKRLASAGHLGASFFFKQGEGDRGSPAKLFTTIAAQLATAKPAIVPYIQRAIDTDPAIGNKALREQFEKLICEPLTAVPHWSTTIVIDALDECELDDEVKLIIHLFSRAKASGLRVFITSRPELPIRLGFQDIKNQYKEIILHEIAQDVVEHDLLVFLQHELAIIRNEYNRSVQEYRRLEADWPGRGKINTLVTMAIPLFIFAATVCRFLSDRRCGDPNDKLREVLDYQTKSQESQLDATYLPVLNRQIAGLSKRQKNKALQEFQSIVGSIVLLASPLSTSALEKLLDISISTINARLDMLHSVLSIPSLAESPIRMLHLSFRDFLIDPGKQGENEFWVDEAQAHTKLAARCLQCMTEFLREDICNLRSRGLEAEVSMPDSQKVKLHIPAYIQYACLNWVFHLQGARDQVNYEEAFQFVKEHFLHWVEALSLMRQAPQSITIIRNLQNLSQASLFQTHSGHHIPKRILTIEG